MIDERHEKILRLLSIGKRVKIADLVEQLNVSVATIRKDLEILEKANLLKRVYGGAISAEPRGLEMTLNTREHQNHKEKLAIGYKISEMVEDGDTIAIDNGTTTHMVAKHLIHKQNLTIITNSVIIAFTFANHKNSNIYFIGGHLRNDELATSGIIASDTVKKFSVDKAIVGCGGISRSGWVTDFHLEEAHVRKCMIDIAKIAIVAADHSKIGSESFYKVCGLKEIDTLVTDWKISKDDIKWIEENDVQVISASNLTD